MDRHPPRARLAATRLADFLASPHGASVLDALKQSAVRDSAAVPNYAKDAPNVDSASAITRVGLWQATVKDGATWYVRSSVPGEVDNLWSNVRAIPPKSGRPRVVLIGESVARGYFYDPYLNAAAVLQTMLRGATGGEIEVVDLARTDQQLRPLVDLARAALVLKPDAMVVFAGNNWRPMPQPGDALSLEIATLLEQGRPWAHVHRYLEQRLRDEVTNGVSTLAAMARAAGIPLLFVLPEFNLRDWRTDLSAPPLASADDTARWEELRAHAEQALARGDCHAAEQLGRQIYDLDHGCTPAGPNIIADAMLETDRLSDARLWLERARDSAISWPRPESPRCFSVVQEAIRQLHRDEAFVLIDLPRRFQECWPGQLPDRRLFLDYCHLTTEALQVAMAATAEALLPHLGKPPRSFESLLRFEHPVPDQISADAHVLAAVHNANWGQSAAIVEYHCRQAIATSPDASELLLLILDVAARSVPPGLSPRLEAVFERGNASVITLFFNWFHPFEPRFINPLWFGAACAALHDTCPEAETTIGRLLQTEHGVETDGSTDLLDPAYATDSLLIPFDRETYGYYRATSPESRFRLVSTGGQDLTLTMTSRCRGEGPREPIALSVNGTAVTTLPASMTWRTDVLAVPRHLLRAGLNIVSIRWPRLAWQLHEWQRDVALDLASHRLADITPLRGEIRRFSVTAAGRAGARALGAPDCLQESTVDVRGTRADSASARSV